MIAPDEAAIRERQDVLDIAWERINAKGGSSSPRNDYDAGYGAGLDAALLIIEDIGGMDPLVRELQRKGAPV